MLRTPSTASQPTISIEMKKFPSPILPSNPVISMPKIQTIILYVPKIREIVGSNFLYSAVSSTKMYCFNASIISNFEARPAGLQTHKRPRNIPRIIAKMTDT